MIIAVGSKNPSKLAAAARAFTDYFPKETIECIGVSVSSGVSDQPMTTAETIQGAVNRAQAATSLNYTFSVGIEGGLSFYKIYDNDYAVEISFVCVQHCQSGIHEIASSSGFPILPNIVDRIKSGQNLSDAMADVFNKENLGQKNGYIGWLSDDRITREASNADAILLALLALSSLKKQKAL
jgi:inosine/xanthosine triphosphatase